MAETEEASGPRIPDLKEATPYTAESAKAIKAFFKKRKGDPESYVFDEKGNLKGPDGTLNLLRFAPLDPAYREAQEQMRLDEIAALEAELVDAGNVLREAYASGVVPAILRANKEVQDLELRRGNLRSAVREFTDLDNPVTRQILIDQPYETRKLIPSYGAPFQYYQAKNDPRVVSDPDRLKSATDPFDKQVVQMYFRDFVPTRFYGRYVPDEAAPKTSPADAPPEVFRQTLKDGRLARIVFDTEDPVNGFLSPLWSVEFVLNETRYSSAIQAYEAEKAKELGNEALRAMILKTRKARMVRILTQKEVNNPADAKGLWLSIYTAIYQQHPELMAKLSETGTDAIVFADPRPGPSGTGVGEKDAAILDSSKWKGENAAGIAQETVRSRVRENTLEEAPEGPVTESVISEEEQKAAKVGAIINARRNA